MCKFFRNISFKHLGQLENPCSPDHSIINRKKFYLVKVILKYKIRNVNLNAIKLAFKIISVTFLLIQNSNFNYIIAQKVNQNICDIIQPL